jgi:hypothetical protein
MENKLKRPSRIWHQEEDQTGSIDQVYKSDYVTGSINQVDKPDSSIMSIDQVRNQVDKPKTQNQVYTPGSITLEKLRGNPLRIIRFLYSSITDFQRKITGKIQLAEIMKSLEITRDSARTGLRFLNKTGLIFTVEFFPGLNGWTQYKLQDEIFNEIWSIDQVYKSDFKPGLSSSNNNLNTTTTNINPVFTEIDISPLEGTGFVREHLTKFTKLSTEDIQFSINHFAFAYKNKYAELKGKYDDPVKVFIGRLCNGKIWVEHDYVSEEEILLQEKLKAAKQEQERLAKAHKELLDAKFEIWRLQLSEEEKRKIAPDKAASFANAKLRTHFETEVWPGIKAKG